MCITFQFESIHILYLPKTCRGRSNRMNSVTLVLQKFSRMSVVNTRGLPAEVSNEKVSSFLLLFICKREWGATNVNKYLYVFNGSITFKIFNGYLTWKGENRMKGKEARLRIYFVHLTAETYDLHDYVIKINF